MSLRCPFTEQDLTLINNRPGIHLQRSRAFYQWKIDYLLEGETACLYTRQEERLHAFLVLRRHANGTCTICDWMLPEGCSEAKRLLKSAVSLLRPYCDLLTIPMVNPSSAEPALLKNSGFFLKKEWRLPFMIYPTSELDTETLSRLKDLRNWSLRYIDSDTILNG